MCELAVGRWAAEGVCCMLVDTSDRN
jgi:hypothetical protein